jgi:hypothetical protein
MYTRSHINYSCNSFGVRRHRLQGAPCNCQFLPTHQKITSALQLTNKHVSHSRAHQFTRRTVQARWHTSQIPKTDVFWWSVLPPLPRTRTQERWQQCIRGLEDGESPVDKGCITEEPNLREFRCKNHKSRICRPSYACSWPNKRQVSSGTDSGNSWLSQRGLSKGKMYVRHILSRVPTKTCRNALPPVNMSVCPSACNNYFILEAFLVIPLHIPTFVTIGHFTWKAMCVSTRISNGNDQILIEETIFQTNTAGNNETYNLYFIPTTFSL